MNTLTDERHFPQFQFAGESNPPLDAPVVFHTHGTRQWRGTQKVHRNPVCPSLVGRRKPRGISMTLMVERDDGDWGPFYCLRKACVNAVSMNVAEVRRINLEGWEARS